MRKLLICTALLLGLYLSPLAGQDFSHKFGKVTNYEADMTSHERDASAVSDGTFEIDALSAPVVLRNKYGACSMACLPTDGGISVGRRFMIHA